MGQQKQPRDWTRTGTVEGFAEYLRKQSGAFIVLVIRRDDAVLVVDDQVTPHDAADLVTNHLAELAAGVDQARREKKKAARLNWGALRE